MVNCLVLGGVVCVKWKRRNNGHKRIRVRIETEKRQELEREKGQVTITV